MIDLAQEAQSEIAELGIKLLKRPGTGPEDAICVTVGLMRAAETIFLNLGGPALAVAQFRLVADRLKAH